MTCTAGSGGKKPEREEDEGISIMKSSKDPKQIWNCHWMLLLAPQKGGGDGGCNER